MREDLVSRAAPHSRPSGLALESPGLSQNLPHPGGNDAIAEALLVGIPGKIENEIRGF